MKQITINVPNDKYDFFMKLLRSINFVGKFNEEDIIVSEQEKNNSQKN